MGGWMDGLMHSLIGRMGGWMSDLGVDGDCISSFTLTKQTISKQTCVQIL